MAGTISRYASYLVLFFSFFPKLAAGQDVPTPLPSRITFDDLSRATVIGRFGEPLGTFLTIEGQYKVPGLREKEFAYELAVTSVNGKPMKLSIRHDDVEWEPYLDYLKIVRNRTPFQLVGFERAEYSGDIPGEGKFDRRYGMYGRIPKKWGLHSRFHVLAQITETKQIQQTAVPAK